MKYSVAAGALSMNPPWSRSNQAPQLEPFHLRAWTYPDESSFLQNIHMLEFGSPLAPGAEEHPPPRLKFHPPQLAPTTNQFVQTFPDRSSAKPGILYGPPP